MEIPLARLLNPIALAVITFSGALSLHAQQPADTAQKPSSLIAPALDSVAKAGSSVDLNKWKGGNTVREEVDANLLSMQKDIQNTLPPLLAASDAAPASPSAAMPVLLNLDALYSVLLRVVISSRTNAPRDENVQLEQAAQLLDSARRDLGDTILTTIRAQDKRVRDLQATVQQQAATITAAQQAAAAPPPPPPAKPKRRPTAKKQAATVKPATPAPTPAK